MMTLQEYVDNPSFDLDIGSSITDLSYAIDHLHSLGFCHNDVNPRNIMFDNDNRIILTTTIPVSLKGNSWSSQGLKSGRVPLMKDQPLRMICMG